MGKELRICSFRAWIHRKETAAILSLCAVLGSVSITLARELKVDLGVTGRPNIGAAHFIEWAWDSSHPARRFGDLTITLRKSGGSGARLDAGIYKFGIDYRAVLACDGVSAAGGDTNGGLEMVISGLTPGPHTVATYHNSLRPATRPIGDLDIYVNGALVVSNFPPSIQATNDYDTASAYLRVQAVRGEDLVLRFAPESSGPGREVVLNGFEIDTSNPAAKAIKPSPANDDEHIDAHSGSAQLSWSAPASAVSHDVYFGTNAAAVAAADHNSPLYQGRRSVIGYLASSLHPSDNYYWRVDEVDASNHVTRGDLWRFRPRHLAFPTAEGYGRFALGGRGGRVIEVNNLEDYDETKGQAVVPGSFRAAVEAEGPRTIVFRVSGLIRLKRPCAVRNPYCTVAGQTAPGDGICLANYSSGAYGTHDVIIRFMRFRIGDLARKGMDGAGLGSCDNCIMDHCSISWSSDEGTSSRGAKNITFQRNIVAEALQHSYHYRASDRTKFETHAFAGSISGDIGSFHHNLLAHCTDRNWSLAGGLNQSAKYAGYLDIRNNVVYNWTARTTDGGVARMNYVNNYYKPHPPNPFVKWLLKLDPINPAWGDEKYYMSGNILEGYVDATNNWEAGFYNGPSIERQVRVDEPLFPSYVQTQTAREAFTNVLADVGATFPKQDVIDRRLIEEVRTGTTHYIGTKGPTYGDRPGPNYAGIIDEPSDDKDALGSPDFPWPDYRTYNVPVDSDHDGMPDDWEKRMGLNPHDPTDARRDCTGDGYTNLEKYLGWLVGEFPDPEKLRGRNAP